MAQLIKLEDYISRYEWNIYRYPSHFIRLKQENWQKLYRLWSNPADPKKEDEPHKKDTGSMFSKWKTFFQRRTHEIEEESTSKEDTLPTSEMELRHYFLDKLFPIQLKWATSTVTEVSFVDESHYNDRVLKYFLQRFPDTYLVMFYPIFNIKKAPVDGDIILISPIGIEIIYLLEETQNTRIIADDERTWIMEKDHKQINFLSPLVALKRSEQIIKSILQKEEIDFPIKKIVLSRTNKIVFRFEPFNTSIIEKDTYKQWFNGKRNLKAPLKNQQLKASEALLKHCQTTSVKRPEWEEEMHGFQMDT